MKLKYNDIPCRTYTFEIVRPTVITKWFTNRHEYTLDIGSRLFPVIVDNNSEIVSLGTIAIPTIKPVMISSNCLLLLDLVFPTNSNMQHLVHLGYSGLWKVLYTSIYSAFRTDTARTYYVQI